MAVCMVALLSVAALVIDGGFGYSNRRQMQNAADSAALAGADALQGMRFAGSTKGIDTAAKAAASENGSSTTDSSLFDCRMLTLSQSKMDPLPAASAMTACSAVTPANASAFVGVYVQAGENHSTLLASVNGNGALTTRAQAAASVQQARFADGPWAICGDAAIGGYDFLTASGKLRPENELKAEYGGPREAPSIGGSKLVDPDGGGALPRSFPVHGKLDSGAPAGVDPWCGGLSANWKGLIDPDFMPVALDTVIGVDNGKKVGHYDYKKTLGTTEGCPDSVNTIDNGVDDFGASFDNCLVSLPIFDQVLGPDQVHVAAVATFRIFYQQTGDSKYYAQFVCSCQIDEGETTSDITTGGLHAIRLIR